VACDLTFRLDVANALGLADPATAVVHVGDFVDARYVLHLDRRPGYPGYGPPVVTVTEFDGAFGQVRDRESRASLRIQRDGLRG
jgi:hypothetical protein